MTNIATVLRYWVSPEESRPGRQDYWNHTFLAGKSRSRRFCWEASKVGFILVLSANIVAGLTRVL